MKAVFARASVLGLAALLSGCATGGAGPVQVTRFHLGEPVARGQIAVEPFDGRQGSGPEFRTYAAAVEAQLVRLGWTIVASPGRSEQVALVGIDQGEVLRERRGPVSIGVGGGTGSYGSGAGIGVGFNLGGRPRALTGATLHVRIKRRSDGTIFWEGRAAGSARADRPEGSPAALAARLADAVFRDFPGNSGQTISIK